MKVRGQEVKIIKEYEKIIKEYEKFILVEFPAGYRECIDKFEINKVKNKRKIKEPILRGITGLKDKNGKEIYEGDIVRFEDRRFN